MHRTWTLLQWEELTEFGSLHKLILRGFKFLAFKLKIVISLETRSGIIESHCCNFQGIGVVFERSVSWWFEHKLQQLPLKCWLHLMYSTFEPSLVLVTNRVRFACYSHCWFPGEVQCVFTKSANSATNIHGGYQEVQGTCTTIAINILHITCKYPINLLHPKFYLYGHRMTSLP